MTRSINVSRMRAPYIKVGALSVASTLAVAGALAIAPLAAHADGDLGIGAGYSLDCSGAVPVLSYSGEIRSDNQGHTTGTTNVTFDLYMPGGTRHVYGPKQISLPSTYSDSWELNGGDGGYLYSITPGDGLRGADLSGLNIPEDCPASPTPDPTPSPTLTPTETPAPEPTESVAPTSEPTTSASPVPSPVASGLPASVSLSSSTVTPGGQVTVTGRGYAPGETVEIWLHSTPVKLADLTVGTDGTFSRTVTIPPTIEVGAHTVEVKAATSGTTSRPLTVLAGLAVTGMESSLTGVLGGAAALLLVGGIAFHVSRRRRLCQP